ncbi:molybdate ABC transporter substrate-binding protein [Arenibaculum pallidiluteum]|uniref:molybdate ABC transporter substrate-binding protein n=1 Tax=Arenibaculum pallidiluteum TaxID=2812559 RepID=UPI001A96CF99|nr:molybdate ABC transporter substrate-binding protein [Arenibaculum pallidiluteum]
MAAGASHARSHRGGLLASLALFAAVLCGAIAPARAAEPVPVIAAASDLKFALEEIADRFRGATGQDLRLAFGSSGNFARQIQQGAPFELFLSADENFVLRLADAGLTADRGALYAVGRIVLFVPKGSPYSTADSLRGLAAAVRDGRVKRFAIANPEHAPYGRAAEEALRSQGVWDAVQPSLVLGENVSQAAQFAMTGSAQGGIFAYSLALADGVGDRGSFVLLPQEWHAPLRQRMVLLQKAGDTARRFYAYLQEAEARAVFRRYGFVLPGEGS